ncbi:hypothetical protein [Saccharicrinis sp. 156]
MDKMNTPLRLPLTPKGNSRFPGGSGAPYRELEGVDGQNEYPFVITPNP